MYLGRRTLKDQSSAKHGVALSITAGGLNILASIALFPLVVSTIGAAQYGIWLVLLALCSYFFYSDLGIGSAIVYFASSARGGNQNFSLDQLISNGIAWVSTILVVVLPGFLFIAFQYAQSHAAASGLTHRQVLGVVIVGGVLVTSILFRPYESVLIGTGHLVLDRMNQIAGTVLRVVLVLTLCMTDASVTTIAAAEAAGLCLPPVLAAVYIARKRIARVRFSHIARSSLRRMFGYSIKSFSVDMIGVAMLQAATVMVGIIKGPAPAAYFALAMRVFNGAGQVINWATAPVRPTFSQISHADPTTSKGLVRDLLTVVATIGIICVVPIALSSVIWIRYWIADDGLAFGIGACVVISLVGVMSTTILVPVVLTCDSFGRPGVAFPAVLFSAALFVLLGIPLTTRYGIVGTAISLAIALWVVQPWCLVILSRTLGMAFRSDVASCYRLPVLVLLAGGALAALTEFVAAMVGLNGGWVAWLGFLVGTAAVLILPVSREAFEASRRLLELPM
jgi:O-antigen/teichoic acid export membrane protein